MVNRNLISKFDLSEDELQQQMSEALASKDASSPPHELEDFILADTQVFDVNKIVNGKVANIVGDSVVIDIGYKSEGVIPANELSIRKAVDPADEVHLGEEVDAIVLTKEDQDGRLIMSKKRARFEKAWRRIEVAADSELVLRTLGEHTFRRFVEIKRQEWDEYRVQVTPFEIENFLPIL